MARPKKDSSVDLSATHDLSIGIIERLTCPDGVLKAFIRDKDVTGLKVRVTANGAKSFVYEAKLNGKAISRTLGSTSLMTISEAKNLARELSKTVKTDKKDPRDLERQQQSVKAAEQATQLEKETYTLAKLLDAYCDYLKSLDRRSHSDARSIFKNHVLEAWPQIASLPANEIEGEQVADMMRKTIEAGKDRTANKLRSYMRSAYQIAKASRSKPSIPIAFKAFNHYCPVNVVWI